MKRLFAAAVIATGVFATSSQADLIAYWNFNTFDPENDVTINADVGTGVIDLNSWGGGVAAFLGSTVNALFGDLAGDALALQGGDDGGSGVFPGNGTWIDITFSATNVEDIVLSFASRRTGTGFDSNQVSYSTDGVSFTNFGSTYEPPNNTTYDLFTFDFGDLLDHQASVIIRITFEGATSSAGNNRLDNVQINGTVIPAPGALALLAVAGLAAGRRRRNES